MGGGGFTVDQFNNVIETISVNVSSENMNWKAFLDYIYISEFPVKLSLCLIASLCCVCLTQTFQTNQISPPFDKKNMKLCTD